MSGKRVLYGLILIGILAVATISATRFVQSGSLFGSPQVVHSISAVDHGDVLQEVSPRMYKADQDHGDKLQQVSPRLYYSDTDHGDILQEVLP